MPFNYLLGHHARRVSEASAYPEAAALNIRRTNPSLPFQQVLARVRRKLPINIDWTVLRAALDEPVYVTVCNLQRENVAAEMVCSSSKQLSQIVPDHAESRVMARRKSHEVILARTNRMCDSGTPPFRYYPVDIFSAPKDEVLRRFAT